MPAPATRRTRRVARASVGDAVLARLTRALGRGAYRPGAAVPGERELARRLGASRPSLREALRTLTVMGALERRHGVASRVAPSSANVLRASFAFLLQLDRPALDELGEARDLIEVHLAGRAARHRDDGDLAALDDALAAMRAAPAGSSAAAESNLRFHRAIAAAARNVVLERIVDCLSDGIRGLIRAAGRGGRDPRQTLAAHARIVDAIRRRDEPAARRAMERHMALSRADRAAARSTRPARTGAAHAP